jgi:hypothetical protein
MQGNLSGTWMFGRDPGGKFRVTRFFSANRSSISAGIPAVYNRSMFFRRERPKVASFQQKLDALKAAGFSVTPAGSGVRISRDFCAVDLKETDAGYRIEERAGILMNGEIGSLVDGGYQKFFRTPHGVRQPATAAHLKALHDFEGDLMEALGEKSLYNIALGTVSTLNQYDRVKDRDRGVPKRAWD